MTSPQKSVQTQLNRLLTLLRQGLSHQEEKQASIVLQSLFEFSDSQDFTVSLNISDKFCEICQSLVSESECTTTTFSCGHKLCSKDCLVQYLASGQLSEIMACPRKACEIKTKKELVLLNFVNNMNDLDIENSAVFCGICEKLGPITQSRKLPCSDRFCNMCILNYIRSEQYIEYGQNCPVCFKKIPKQTVNAILSPEFEENIRASFDFN